MANIVSTPNAGAAAAVTAKTTPAAEAKGAVAQPLDRARLDRLRSAIQAGQYPLDAGKLAARILDLRETVGK